jgi:hypothetical protein
MRGLETQACEAVCIRRNVKSIRAFLESRLGGVLMNENDGTKKPPRIEAAFTPAKR